MRLKRWFELVLLGPLGMATSLLMNYVRLEPGVPTRLHFTDDYTVERTIKEKESGKPKTIKTFVFWVDELNGELVARSFSIMSQKLYAHFEPFLKDKRYEEYDFIITEMGSEFYKDWNVQTIKRPT